MMCPWMVVPHPKNRGDDQVNSLRLRQLTGTLAVEGYDPVEANSNGVVVQEKPAVVGKNSDLFQSAFAEKMKTDPDVAEQIDGILATVASLSHSHLNVALRNILGGKRGCECSSEPASSEPALAGKKCNCSNRPILDKLGNYSMSALRSHDEEWWRGCQLGIEWEVLSWKMDEEEPHAASIICIALNKKNEVAMKTGHLEIMSSLVSLCVPDCRGNVQFDPVRDKLIDLYGSAVDHPDSVHAFRLVMAAGGADSVHMTELLQDFTTVFANQKLRKMRMEAYAVVAPYPVEFPRIKNACLKWPWRQDTKQGWCQMPVNISHRLDVSSKHSWYDLMSDIEEALRAITVVEKGLKASVVYFQFPKTRRRNTADRAKELRDSKVC